MALIIIWGIKRFPDKAPVVDGLYIGFDGDKAHKAAEAAADSGEFSDIRRIVGPEGARLRIEPHHDEFAERRQEELDQAKADAQALEDKKKKAAEAEKAQAAELARQQEENRLQAAELNKSKKAENQTKADEFVSGKPAGKKAKPAKADDKPAEDAQ